MTTKTTNLDQFLATCQQCGRKESSYRHCGALIELASDYASKPSPNVWDSLSLFASCVGALRVEAKEGGIYLWWRGGGETLIPTER